jgi:hypothetical protein
MMQIRSQYDRLSRLLTPVVKAKVRQAVPSYLATASGLHTGQALHAAAAAALNPKFPLASPGQRDVLAFYLLSLSGAARDAVQDRADSMSEMGEMSSMRLQMAMDRRSKFVEALSNILKKVGSTQDAIVRNLK